MRKVAAATVPGKTVRVFIILHYHVRDRSSRCAPVEVEVSALTICDRDRVHEPLRQ